jgi:hypothetical protein
MTTLDHSRLLALLSYDPQTGIFIWRCNRPGGVKAGAQAGYVHKKLGYVLIGIDGEVFLGHRLARFYMTGSWPPEETDHRDLRKSNNKFDNLREATSLQNKGNRTTICSNTSGVTGVSFVARLNRWHAYIGCPRTNLGWFKSFDEAVAARRLAEINRYGAFAHTKSVDVGRDQCQARRLNEGEGT